MANENRKIIGINIKAIRKTLGLSQLNFSIITNISRASLINMESCKSGYSLDLLESITEFTGYSLRDISDTTFSPDKDLRNTLTKKYVNDTQKSGILKLKPEISYAIIYKVLENKILDEEKEINEIKKYLDSLGWNYYGTSISNALKNMPDLIKILPHPQKKGTFLYLARR